MNNILFLRGKYMKLFVNKKLFDHKGDVIKADGANGPAALLGTLCVNALLAETQADQSAEFKTKMHKWNLSRQIQKGLEDTADDAFVEMPIEDMDLIKKRIGMIFPTALCAPIIHALES